MYEHKYDRIRTMPTSTSDSNVHGGACPTCRKHESLFKSWAILREVKELLNRGADTQTVKELVEFLETNPFAKESDEKEKEKD